MVGEVVQAANEIALLNIGAGLTAGSQILSAEPECSR